MSTQDEDELDKYCKERARHIVSGFRNVISIDAITDIQSMIWAELMEAGRAREQSIKERVERDLANRILDKNIKRSFIEPTYTDYDQIYEDLYDISGRSTNNSLGEK